MGPFLRLRIRIPLKPKTFFFCLLILSRVDELNKFACSPCMVVLAQLVEYCSTNAEATGSNPVEAPPPPQFLFLSTSQLLKLRFQLRLSHLHFNRICAVHIISFCINIRETTVPLRIAHSFQFHLEFSTTFLLHFLHYVVRVSFNKMRFYLEQFVLRPRSTLP